MRWPRGTSAPWCQARHAGRLDSRSTAARVARPLLNGIQNRAETSVVRVPSTERPRFLARPNGPPPPNRVMLGSAKDRSGRAAIAKAGATDAAAADAHTPRRSWSPVRPHTRLRCRCGLPGRRLVARRGARPAWRTPAPPQTPAAVSAPQRGDTDPLSPRRACAHRCCLVWRRRGRVHPCAFFLFCLSATPAVLFGRMHWLSTAGGGQKRERRNVPFVASTWVVLGGHARPPPSPPHSP